MEESIEKKIEKVISDISDMCEKAHINEKPENFIHVLIAYLRTPKVKQIGDYAINGLIARIICDVIKTCKNKEMLITLDELKILCDTIRIDDSEKITIPAKVVIVNEPKINSSWRI